MGTTIQEIVRRLTSVTFQRSFALILVAQLIMIAVAWLFLGINTQRWISGKTAHLVKVSQMVASRADWSRINEVPKDHGSALGDHYQDILDKFSRQYFPSEEGSVYVAIIDHGEEYDMDPGGTPPLTDRAKANQTEIKAFETRQTAYSAVPIIDDYGTYLAAYTPIIQNGKTIGLLAAEYDSAPLADFKAIVRTAFLYSISPAIFISLVIAFILASTFVEPSEIFRSIHETEEDQRERSLSGDEDDLWQCLTPRQLQVAELTRQGLSYKEIAAALGMKPGTVNEHFKEIRKRTGWSMRDLAVQAEARRRVSA